MNFFYSVFHIRRCSKLSGFFFFGMCHQIQSEFKLFRIPTPMAQVAERLDVTKALCGILGSNPDDDITCNFF